MRRTRLLFLLPVLLGPAAPSSAGDEPSTKTRKDRLLEIYRGDAAGYQVYRDSRRQERVELRREPVYVWTNQIRNGSQDGAVFVWTCRGRSELVATFFSYPPTGPRSLNHELHSLATTILDVSRPGASNTWQPEAPGIDLAPLPGAPAPARSAPQRLLQMRTLTRGFTATSEDKMGKRWELRLLPQPLYRYESTDPDVLDGALFTFVTSAGTDPEVMVVVEARRAKEGVPFTWQYAVGRFSDLQLWVRYQGQEVFTCPDMPYDTPKQDPKFRYHSFRDRTIPPIEDQAP